MGGGDKFEASAQIEVKYTNVTLLDNVLLKADTTYKLTFDIDAVTTVRVYCFYAIDGGAEQNLHIEIGETHSEMFYRPTSDVRLTTKMQANTPAIGITVTCVAEEQKISKFDVLQNGIDGCNARIDALTASRTIIQNANLYDGEIVPNSRYDYNTGKVYASSSTHCRNKNPVPMIPNNHYTVQVKAGYGGGGISIYLYDDNMAMIGTRLQATDEPVRVTGASFCNFAIANYSSRYPDETLHVMVWESETDDGYKKWLEYGEPAIYTDDGFVLSESAIISTDYTLNTIKARFDASFNYIAYSSITGSTAKINSREHFVECAKLAFVSLKGDVRPTSDGKLVMCHDAGFTLNSDGRVTSFNAGNYAAIHDMTEAQCLALRHTNDDAVVGFDEYVRICKKYGKVPFVTIRDEYTDTVVDEVLRVLKKYSMENDAIINSMTYASLEAARKQHPTICLCYTMASSVRLAKTHIDYCVNLGNCIVNGFDFPSFGGFANLEAAQEVLAYAQEKNIRVYEAQNGDAADVDRLLEYGVVGSHMTVVPEM